MADGLGASVKVVRRMQVSAEGIKELPLDDAPSIAWPSSVKEEPPIAAQSIPQAQNEISIRIPEVPSPAPPYYIHKRRLTKKDRRQVKREKEIWLRTGEKQQLLAAGPDQDDLGLIGSCVDDNEGDRHPDMSSTTSSSSVAYVSVTPPVDEIPQLSHSPSPPSSTSGSQHCSIQHTYSVSTIDQGNYTYTAGISSLTTPASDAPVARAPSPMAIEITEAEEAQYALRRHLRKQWKKEKQHAKQLERSRQAMSAHPSRRRRNSNAVSLANERYLDGLVVLFDNAILASETAEEAITASQIGSAQHIPEQKKHTSNGGSHRGRHRRRGPAFSPTSTPLSGTLTPAIAMKIAAPPASSTDPSLRNTWNAKRHPAPVSKSAAGAPRYAVECIIMMPSACVSRIESDDEAELALFGADDLEDETPVQPQNAIPMVTAVRNSNGTETAAAYKTEKDRKASRPGRERTRLQSFIDFETVWDELEMDL